MTDNPANDDTNIDDKAMFMRTFELDGREAVKAWVWPPQAASKGPGTDCWYQITGIGNEKPRFARGIDGLQALIGALQFIAVELRSSPEYKAGRLTLYGKGDLHLPDIPGG